MVSQAWNLIDRMRSDESVDFFNDWKLITIFVGTNDLCQTCTEVGYINYLFQKYILVCIPIYQLKINVLAYSILNIVLKIAGQCVNT